MNIRLVSPCQPSLMTGDVDVDDVAVLQRPVVRDAVADWWLIDVQIDFG
jgi:hypothetical protein